MLDGIFSVIEVADVVSGLSYSVVLLVAKGATGVTDSVVLVEVTFGNDTVPVSAECQVGRGE